MIRATGLWVNKTSKGTTYLSGTLGGVRVLIFKNDKKEEGSSQPDYNMCLDENKPKDSKAHDDESTSF